MHERYTIPEITEIWSDANKLMLWQETELAVLAARTQVGEISREDYETIRVALLAHPPDIKWWKKREAELHHDLAAFLDERTRFILKKLRLLFHKSMTSYDTEEPAFARMLILSVGVLDKRIDQLMTCLEKMAFRYRFTPMMGTTHGQWADLQSFGKRLACWYGDIKIGHDSLYRVTPDLRFSKLSGFVGNYTGLSPRLEDEALKLLCLKPYYGATQIMPRELYISLSSAMLQLSKTLAKIAMTLRLGARSGTVLYQEPFGKLQKGSSAGPQKRNPIRLEKIQGLDNMIEGYAGMIQRNANTWEERDISQSCVERVAWPDMFHALIHAFDELTKVLSGLVVYPQNMLAEIVKTNGCYAASVAKEALKEIGADFGLSAEDCYRIVQLAAFNLGYDPGNGNTPTTLAEADFALQSFQKQHHKIEAPKTIKDVIRQGKLQYCEQLNNSQTTINHWNKILLSIFNSSLESCQKWDKCFEIRYLLRNEATVFKGVFGAKFHNQPA